MIGAARIAELKAACRAAEVGRESAEERLASDERVLAALQLALEAAQGIAQDVQQQAHKRIASVVTRCLAAVFDDPYEFRLDFDRKRGKTEARMVFSRDGLESDDPTNEIGGGVIDVAALALRLSAVMLVKPARRRLLVLDEPFRNVRGRGNRKRVRKMLTELATECGFQFVLNVDADSYPEFALGKIVDLSEA